MSNYWQKRQVDDAFSYFEQAEKKAEEIAKVYMRASRYLQYKADDIFDRYQTKHGLSEREARELIGRMQDKGSINEMMQILRNSESDDTKKDMIAQLEAPAYQARIERLHNLQNQLNLIMQEVYQQEQQIQTEFYTELAQESYYRTIYNTQQRVNAAFSFAKVSQEIIESVINSHWSGKNYSERIWINTQELAERLKEGLLVNLITGRTNEEAAKAIELQMSKGANNARRLIRTESNYVSTELNFKAYEACNVEKYQYLATLDLKTCVDHCRPLDGKLFPVKEREIGVNCPPMHPWCRCTTISVVNEKYIKKMQRSALKPETGEQIQVPRTMTYQEWYDTYVKGNEKAEIEEKKIQNQKKDWEQFLDYQKRFGEKKIQDFTEFQEMKYNKPEKWKELKAERRKKK